MPDPNTKPGREQAICRISVGIPGNKWWRRSMYRRGGDRRSAEDHDRLGPYTTLRREVGSDALTTSSQSCAMANPMSRSASGSSKRRKTSHLSAPAAICALLASNVTTAMAASCISLAGSTQCPSFNASSVSTDTTLVGFFPFLSSVTDLATFDSGLEYYIANGFTETQYGTCLMLMLWMR